MNQVKVTHKPPKGLIDRVSACSRAVAPLRAADGVRQRVGHAEGLRRVERVQSRGTDRDEMAEVSIRLGEGGSIG